MESGFRGGRISAAKHIYGEYYWVKVGNVFVDIKWLSYYFMWYLFSYDQWVSQ
jgi:hypothetical protein